MREALLWFWGTACAAVSLAAILYVLIGALQGPDENEAVAPYRDPRPVILQPRDGPSADFDPMKPLAA